MPMLSYERLKLITEIQKPYRRSTNRYPLDYRVHGYKCFFVEKDAQGNDEYHIAYGYRYDRVTISKKEYTKAQASGNSWSVYKASEEEHYKYVRDWAILGTVRNDNTFEFTTEYLHQGDRMFLSGAFGSGLNEVVSSVKHGGAIYREYIRDEEKTANKKEDNRWSPTYYIDTKVIPLFKGQRIDVAAGNSVINYEVHLPYVNRQRSKEVMAEYNDQLNFAETMFKTMTSEVFASEMRDVYNEIFPDNDDKPRWGDNESTRIVCEYANKNLKNDLYRYMYAVMLSTRTLNSWAIGSNNPSYRNDIHFPLTYFQNSKAKFIKTLKLINNALDEKVYKANEVYPSNSWEVKILVDGNVVRSY